MFGVQGVRIEQYGNGRTSKNAKGDAGYTETQRQLTQLQRGVAAEQSEVTKKVVQKLEEEKTATFKKKGNKIQFRFNKQLDTAWRMLWRSFVGFLFLEPLVEGSSEVSAAVTAARVKLTEGRLDIACRQKRIRIVDRSEFGWMTVEFYKHDELASDSGDEKKLEKVEKEAKKCCEKEA